MTSKILLNNHINLSNNLPLKLDTEVEYCIECDRKLRSSTTVCVHADEIKVLNLMRNKKVLSLI